MANTITTLGKLVLMTVKSIPSLLVLLFLNSISLFEHFPKIAAAILETVCDTLSAMARLVGGSITMPRCLDRYSRFKQFPELPTEVQNMVFEAIGRSAKPRFQLLSYGTKPTFLYDPSRRSGNGLELLLEQKALEWSERNLLRHLDDLTAYSVYSKLDRADTTSIIHSWFRNKEDKELAAIEQVNGITYATSLGLSRVHPARCPYRHGDNGDRRCTGRDDCIARCNRSVRFSPKNDIFSVFWYNEDIDWMLDTGGDIPDWFCLKVPPLADIERFAFLHLGPETWGQVYNRMVGYWPCHMPQLREIYLICTGHIEPIGSAALPAPFLESGGFKLTELDPTKVRFTESEPKDQNMAFSVLQHAKARELNTAFDVVRRAQEDYDAKFHRLVTEEDRLPLEVRVDLPEEYSRRRVQVKLVHMEYHPLPPDGTKTTVWASNKLSDFYLDAKK